MITTRKESLMDPRTAAVGSRIDDLRRLSAELHLEREAARSRPQQRSGLRVALGRRLVSLGTSLLGQDVRGRVTAGR